MTTCLPALSTAKFDCVKDLGKSVMTSPAEILTLVCTCLAGHVLLWC